MPLNNFQPPRGGIASCVRVMRRCAVEHIPAMVALTTSDLLGEAMSARVVRRVEQKHPGLGGDGFFELHGGREAHGCPRDKKRVIELDRSRYSLTPSTRRELIHGLGKDPATNHSSNTSMTSAIPSSNAIRTAHLPRYKGVQQPRP